jgi:hypothetical protein
MNIINLTPHKIDVLCSYGTISIVPSGKVARVATSDKLVHHVYMVYNGTEVPVPVNLPAFGSVVDLPEPEEGTFYIVSRIVKNAVPERTDVLVPGNLVRDAAGVIIGCNGFSL